MIKIYRTHKVKENCIEFNIWANIGGFGDPYLSYSCDKIDNEVFRKITDIFPSVSKDDADAVFKEAFAPIYEKWGLGKDRATVFRVKKDKKEIKKFTRKVKKAIQKMFSQFEKIEETKQLKEWLQQNYTIYKLEK